MWRRKCEGKGIVENNTKVKDEKAVIGNHREEENVKEKDYYQVSPGKRIYELWHPPQLCQIVWFSQKHFEPSLLTTSMECIVQTTS